MNIPKIISIHPYQLLHNYNNLRMLSNFIMVYYRLINLYPKFLIKSIFTFLFYY
jgi:hypothetical protein